MSKIALIGLGNWGANHLRVLIKNNLLAGIYDKNKKIKNFKNFKNLDEISFDKNVKGVIIATPPNTHFELAKFFIQKKIPVLVEKPVCLNFKDTITLYNLSLKFKTKICVGHLLFFHPAIEKITEIINKRIIGKIKYIESNRLNLGRIRDYEDILWSFAPHDISIIDNLIKNKKILEIKCVGNKINNTKIADISTTIIKYSNILAKISVSWLHYQKKHELFILGKNGMIVFNDTNTWDKKLKLIKYKINKKNEISTKEKFYKLIDKEPLEKEILNFDFFIKDKIKTSPIELKNILNTMKILEECSNQIKNE